MGKVLAFDVRLLEYDDTLVAVGIGEERVDALATERLAIFSKAIVALAFSLTAGPGDALSIAITVFTAALVSALPQLIAFRSRLIKDEVVLAGTTGGPSVGTLAYALALLLITRFHTVQVAVACGGAYSCLLAEAREVQSEVSVLFCNLQHVTSVLL